MLRISKKADYAVFLLGAIARRGAYPGGAAHDSVVSAQEIANEAGLGKSVVANLLKEFAKDRVLTSVRGLRGGYRLTMAPDALSLGRILRVVDGPVAVTECSQPAFFDEQVDPSAPNCSVPDHSVPDQNGANARQTASAPHGHDDSESCCSLIAFCPSKRPMEVVQERVVRIFEDIHLDELCGLTELSAAGSTSTQTTVSHATVSHAEGAPSPGCPPS